MKPHVPVNRDDRSDGADHLFGIHVISEWLVRNPKRLTTLFHESGESPALREIVERARRAGVRLEVVPRARLEQMTRGGRHQGVVAKAAAFPYADLGEVLESRPRLLLALDQMNDPRNLGAIIRCAAALGVGAVVMPKDGAVAITGVVEMAASGGAASVPICRVANLARALADLKDPEAGYWSVVLDPQGAAALPQLALPERLVLVVGGESGVRRLVRERCDYSAFIPMAGGVESLNAAVAAAIGLYEVNRQWNTLTR